ncbi:MAG TPA: hypothetical protein VLZ89_08615 [Anaerolineales bacterium]|nr:hypothetical protein [Anaerolineales bacterium]
MMLLEMFQRFDDLLTMDGSFKVLLVGLAREGEGHGSRNRSPAGIDLAQDGSPASPGPSGGWGFLKREAEFIPEDDFGAPPPRLFYWDPGQIVFQPSLHGFALAFGSSRQRLLWPVARPVQEVLETIRMIPDSKLPFDQLGHPRERPAIRIETTAQRTAIQESFQLLLLLRTQFRSSARCFSLPQTAQTTRFDPPRPIADRGSTDSQMSRDVRLRHPASLQQPSALQPPFFQLLVRQIRWFPCHPSVVGQIKLT